MQILRTGSVVLVRRSRWHIVDIRPYEGCQVVTLHGVGPLNSAVERRVLVPFDRIEPLRRSATPRFVRARTWRRVCRALVAGAAPPGALRAAAAADIDLLPHQLEPALAIVRGLATRLLLADEVGLGKTIQAGLIAAELLRRNACERVLILTPAGLRDQWVAELGNRFAIDAAAVDGPLLRRLSTTLPIGFNPWRTLSIAVASIDYVKRGEVLPAVAACLWDLVIVDEAHGVCGDSDRHAAAQAVAAGASYVVLLTATPHSGDLAAFDSLCQIGRVRDAAIGVFRRTRAEVGLGVRRRVHSLQVRATDNELRMHQLLGRYADALCTERRRNGQAVPVLALSVLHKRAFSSAWSLKQSIGRRLAALAGMENSTAELQLALPLDDFTGELIRADEPPAWPAELHLADAARERRLLAAVLEAADEAARSESKLGCLGTLLRRVREPAIVFTEYRDTLAHVRRRLARDTIVLHGGLSREERVAALSGFAAARDGVLLATDAAAEGLNLHQRCRLVVNLELPWNPMRLEQRIGRVDRIGQTRTVHAFHLVARNTGEARIAERLRRRLEAAAQQFGAPNPLDSDDGAAALLMIDSTQNQ